MRTRLLIVTLGVTFWLGCSGGMTAPAAAGTAPARRAHARRNTHRRHSSTQVRIASGFVGDKASHIYYREGDTRRLPPARQRIYFRSEAAASAAGYHPIDWRPGRVLSEIKTPSERYAIPHQPFRRQQPTTAPTQPAPNQ